jgi:radical SAM superfamily enzyme YgiQ (UPF0313 family)
MKEYGVDSFEIYDDIFNHDRKRMLEVCGLIEKLEKKVKWFFPNGLSMDKLDNSAIDSLAAAGMRYCSCPFESGSPRIKKLMGKNLNLQKFMENVEYIASKKIFTQGFSIMGFPTETAEDLKQTLNVTCQSRLHVSTVFILTPFPNTRVYDMILKNNPEKLKTVYYDDKEYLNMKHNFSDVPDEMLCYYQRKANRDFYKNPSRIARILRDFPQRRRLPSYIPEFFKRISQGIY